MIFFVIPIDNGYHCPASHAGATGIYTQSMKDNSILISVLLVTVGSYNLCISNYTKYSKYLV